MTGDGDLVQRASGVVVAGTGQAAAQLAMSLRQKGYDGSITLVGEEPSLPYERPPLSKAYLAADTSGDSLLLRPRTFWESKGIEILTDRTVAAIDRSARSVQLSDGARLYYEHLVLATGAQPRRLDVPGTTFAGVHVLRTWEDADRLRAALAEASHVVVVGAGFIGLEVAAIARERGRRVTVIEALDRAMARVVSTHMASAVLDEHRRRGVDVRLSTGLASATDDSRGHVRSVTTSTGEPLTCDLLVLGVGVAPRTELAEAAGLECANGVAVDETLLTADPNISAIGDCASFPSPFTTGAPVRLEAVQNAVDHARCVAERLTGSARPYDAVPWFWTHQYGWKLQVAGLVAGHDRAVVRGSVDQGDFSVFCFAGERLLGVESVNRPADHVLARALLAGEHGLTPDVVADPGADLKSYKPQRPTPTPTAPMSAPSQERNQPCAQHQPRA
ncbi:MAG: NAD(P)/FAD-dependent oxidoreductase [Haloechinothrix sp.]